MTTDTFFACVDEDDYERCVGRLSAGQPIPVLLPLDARQRAARERTLRQWAERHGPSLGSPGPSATNVFAVGARTATVAQLMALRFGTTAEMFAVGMGWAELRSAVRASSDPVMIVVVSTDADDALLLGLLDDLRTALDSDCAWAELPRFTLLTGRDLASLSWVAAKVTASPVPHRERTLVHLSPDIDHCGSRELRLETHSSLTVRRATSGGTEIPLVLTQAADVVAIETHGSDACARGGDGSVLCGLYGGGVNSDAERAGALACGQGLPCPRGPRPVALSDSRADVLLLTSCNGLRLADSNTQAEFNLGLTFLDGLGRAYVASTSSATATAATTTAYLASMAAGRSLVEATTILDAFVHWARIDVPTYLAVGRPDHRVVDGASTVADRATPVITFSAGEIAEIEHSGSTMVELTTRDSAVVAAVRARDLTLTASADDSSASAAPSRFWFARVEGAAGTANEQARIFVFSFPDPVRTLELTTGRATSILSATQRAVASHSRWRELWRLCSHLVDASEDLLTALDETVSELRVALVRRLHAIRYDLDAPAYVRDLTAQIDHCTTTLRKLLIEALVPRLAGSFYLTNELVAEYGFVDSADRPCVYCAGLATRKRLEHPLTADGRVVDVCPRCGIVSDRSAQEGLNVHIQADDLIHRGRQVHVVVTVDRPGVELFVGLRLSTHGHGDSPPDPAIVAIPSSGDGVAHFDVDVPADLPPHEYSWKALVAGRGDLAFAHRLVWVR